MGQDANHAFHVIGIVLSHLRVQARTSIVESLKYRVPVLYPINNSSY